MFMIVPQFLSMPFIVAKISSCSFQDIHNSTSLLSHMVCPKFNSHVYKLKGKAGGEHHFLLLCNWGPKMMKPCQTRLNVRNFGTLCFDPPLLAPPLPPNCSHQVLNVFPKFAMCSSTCSPQHLTFIPYSFGKFCPPFTYIAGGPKGRISILQKQNLIFGGSPSHDTAFQPFHFFFLSDEPIKLACCKKIKN